MGYHDVNFSNYIKNQTDPIILDIGSYNASDAVGFKKQFPTIKSLGKSIEEKMFLI